MSNSIVKIEHISHRYSKTWAVRDIDFEITQNGIIGLLGSNGAGKSTTMNILCGVVNQTEGSVFINGINLRKHPEQAKKHIGFLPQVPPLHPDLTVDEYLTHCAYLRKMPTREITAAVSMAKHKCGITHFSKRLIRNLSGGYRQRVGIAQAIIHTPMLVVLDEPTNGLDPNQIVEIRNLIKEIALERSVIFSSHILSEIQAICRDIKMIEQGKMVFEDTMTAFNNYIQPQSLLMTLAAPPSVEEILAIPGITDVSFLNNNPGNAPGNSPETSNLSTPETSLETSLKSNSPTQIRLGFDAPREIAQTIIRISVEKNWHLQEISFEKSSADEIFAKLSNKTQQR